MELEKIKYIGRLLFLWMRNTLSEDELKELELWRRSSLQSEKLFRQITSEEDWDEYIKRFVKTPEEVEAEWKAICRQTVERQKVVKWRRLVCYAALFTVILGVAISYLYRMDRKKPENPEVVVHNIQPGQAVATLVLSDGRQIELKNDRLKPEQAEGVFEVDTLENILRYEETASVQPIAYHTLSIPRGGEYIVILEDKTKVYLNSESELKYPTRFSGESRRVYLKGEAYFEVTSNKECPFVVALDGMQVKVFGTSFGVRAYDDENNIMTTLVSGQVSISARGREFVLKPNQQALYNRSQDDVTINFVDTRFYVGWKDGRLVFDNVSLETILNTLGRWYNFGVVYTNEKLKDIPFSLDIVRHDNVNTILDLLQHTGKVSFEVNQNIVIVK